MATTFIVKRKIGDKLSVYVHIVTFNHAAYVARAIDALLSQVGFEVGKNLHIRVSDNNSTDSTKDVIKQYSTKGVEISISDNDNFGFAAAHNIGLAEFLKSEAKFYLCHNPDLALERDAIQKMVEAINLADDIGTVCPKLLRADENLLPIQPRTIDAAGIVITRSLRHFDRGSEEKDSGQYDKQEFVFGGSGACLLMKRDYVKDVIINQQSFQAIVNSIYPQLVNAPSERAQVFDEAFFAYREDADLAWRSQLFGWACLYEPTSVGYHVRKVTPERRGSLPKMINLLGVKNRFLLQLNNYSFSYGILVFFFGYVFRNLAVVLAVILKERSSLPAFSQFLKLLRRGIDRRKIINQRIKSQHVEVAYWFSHRSHEF